MSAVSRRTFSIPFLGYPSSQSKFAGIDIPLHCFGTQKIDQLIRERHWPTSDTHAVLPSNLPSNTGPTTHSQRTSINGDRCFITFSEHWIRFLRYLRRQHSVPPMLTLSSEGHMLQIYLFITCRSGVKALVPRCWGTRRKGKSWRWRPYSLNGRLPQRSYTSL